MNFRLRNLDFYIFLTSHLKKDSNFSKLTPPAIRHSFHQNKTSLNIGQIEYFRSYEYEGTLRIEPCMRAHGECEI